MGKLKFVLHGFTDKEYELIGDEILHWCLLFKVYGQCIDRGEELIAPTIELTSEGFSLTKELIASFEYMVDAVFPAKKVLIVPKSDLP